MPLLIVDNRTLLLGIDRHYRDAMKLFEVMTLLPCAGAVAQELGIESADVPVEGYYTESPRLTKYFLLIRALQEVTEERASPAKSLPELRRLLDVMGSPIHGRPQCVRGDEVRMLPTGRDSLWQALDDVEPARWSVPALAAAAYAAAVSHDDFSLVGLAARARDAVAVAALRESVVLYAEKYDLIGGSEDEEEIEYVWRVDPDLERNANRFIDAFNDLVGSANRRVEPREIFGSEFELRATQPIPAARRDNAGHFHSCCMDNEILGRCVNLGRRLDTGSKYHWAIRRSADRSLEVHDFWDDGLLTTQRYREQNGISPDDALYYYAHA